MKKGVKQILIFLITFVILFLLFAYINTRLTGYFSFGDLFGAPGRGGGKTTTVQCQDHIDNDKDGYCDYPYPKAYCSDGSKLGDPDCLSKTGTNESCRPRTEVCDYIDNDCNGLIDDNNVCTVNYYCDNDKDGYYGMLSSGNCTTYGCVPQGCSQYIGNDCNDNNPLINPKAIDNCGNDSIDNDCDGLVDECCKELFQGTNVISADRINIVFVGMLYTDKNIFISQAQSAVDYYNNIASSGPGLMELPVYKDNKNKFNFWYVDTIATPSYMPVSSCTDCSNYNAQMVCSGFPNTYFINFCYTSFRGCAYLGGSSYIATTGSYAGSWPYVVDHEFNHQFPMLYDEYVESGLGDRPGSPNCAPDIATASSWWGMYENQSSTDNQKVGYYDGCSYVLGNYRPTTNSMMRGWVFNLGLVNEKHIEKDLSVFTGSPGPLSNAVEIILSGNPDNPESYEIKNIRQITVYHNNKNKGEFKLKVKTAAKEFTAEFETYEYLIEEEFNSNQKTIKAIKFEKQPKNAIKLIVPIELNKLDDISEISIEKDNIKLKSFDKDKINKAR